LRPLRAALASWSPARGKAPDPVHALAAEWPAIVGAQVAAHSAPREIVGSTLVIATRSSAWSQQLQFLSLAILEAVRAISPGAPVERLSFRAGAFKRNAAPSPYAPASGPPGRVSAVAAFESARDLDEALERVRFRVGAVRRSSHGACALCGAPLGDSQREHCAPCAGGQAERRYVEIERLLYMAPWLSLEDARAHVQALEGPEFERARRRLLQRWWLVLERARRAGRISNSGLERHVATSYVLLQARLPPDRVTPPLIRNLLGAELQRLLWPEGNA
jgi:hypothetical protein